jgi:hypothetical protein
LCCAVCGTKDPGGGDKQVLCVDHNHLTKKVRGLLCHNCNIRIGLSGDDVELLHSAASYLDAWSLRHGPQ